MEYNLPPYRSELPSYQTEPAVVVPPPPNPAINVVLFILTVATTMFAGSFLAQGNPFMRLEDIWLGMPFSFTLLAIIGCHEFGHYFMCRRHGIPATLPYFIPAPPPFLIGTFGALIRIRAPITNNKALFDIGAAGPIAGIVIAIPAIFFGLERSQVVESDPTAFLTIGEPLIWKVISSRILENVPEGFDVILHPVAFAGWVGLVVTALNLLPIGQLDGGHIAYALIGEKQGLLGYTAFFALFILALFWYGWLLFIILSMFIKIKHPAGRTVLEPLDPKRKIIGLTCLILLVVCFIPIPFKGMGLLQLWAVFA